MVFATTIRQKPDLLMGYHIMPNSLVCLIAASIIGASSAYQMTGGPIQVIGGGTGSENSLLRLLVRKSKLLERLLFQTLTYFDLVVVRGQSALAFAKQHGLGKKQIIITAGIDTNVFRPGETPPELDAICVSRLIAGKGLEFLIKIIEHCHQNGYQLKAAIVGDGPIKPILSELLINCGLNKHVTLLGQRNDINNLLKTARIFMLTSQTEGMSIALLEAIATGLPAAITPVGDLGDAVTDGLNGIFLDGKNPHVAASSLMNLLRNDATMNRMSEHARHVAEEQYSTQALAQCWDRYLSKIIAPQQ
jgi:glycosyltransferase involved in cell wall biosynthesis